VEEWISKEKSRGGDDTGHEGQAELGAAIHARLHNQHTQMQSSESIANAQFWEQFSRANDSYELPNESNRFPIRHQNQHLVFDQNPEEEQLASHHAIPERRESLPVQARQTSQPMASWHFPQRGSVDVPPSSSSPPRAASSMPPQRLRPLSEHAEPASASARSSITFDGLAYLVPEGQDDIRLRNSFTPRAM
jgi:hypothetical protein